MPADLRITVCYSRDVTVPVCVCVCVCSFPQATLVSIAIQGIFKFFLSFVVLFPSANDQRSLKKYAFTGDTKLHQICLFFCEIDQNEVSLCLKQEQISVNE